jgi:hypothetical protein
MPAARQLYKVKAEVRQATSPRRRQSQFEMEKLVTEAQNVLGRLAATISRRK